MPLPKFDRETALKYLWDLVPALLLWFIIFLVTNAIVFRKPPDKFDFVIMLGCAVLVVLTAVALGARHMNLLDQSGLQDFRSWCEGWKNQMEQQLVRLEKGTKGSAITLADYFDLLEGTDAQSIQFMGTIVGYSYTMFKPLSDYARRAKGDVNIDIIGTTFKLADEPANHLVIYPVSLVLKTVRELVVGSHSKTEGKKEFTFQVNYVDEDILHAFMAIGSNKIMTVQALAPPNADFIFDNQYEGKILTPQSPASPDARISRYLAAFKNIKAHTTDQRESWTLTMNEGRFRLSVTGSTFWSYVVDKPEVAFSFSKPNQVGLELDHEKLKSFVDAFYARLVQFSPTIEQMDQKVSKEWLKYKKLAKLVGQKRIDSFQS